MNDQEIDELIDKFYEAKDFDDFMIRISIGGLCDAIEDNLKSLFKFLEKNGNPLSESQQKRLLKQCKDQYYEFEYHIRYLVGRMLSGNVTKELIKNRQIDKTPISIISSEIKNQSNGRRKLLNIDLGLLNITTDAEMDEVQQLHYDDLRKENYMIDEVQLEKYDKDLRDTFDRIDGIKTK